MTKRELYESATNATRDALNSIRLTCQAPGIVHSVSGVADAMLAVQSMNDAAAALIAEVEKERDDERGAADEQRVRAEQAEKRCDRAFSRGYEEAKLAAVEEILRERDNFDHAGSAAIALQHVKAAISNLTATGDGSGSPRQATAASAKSVAEPNLASPVPSSFAAPSEDDLRSIESGLAPWTVGRMLIKQILRLRASQLRATESGEWNAAIEAMHKAAWSVLLNGLDNQPDLRAALIELLIQKKDSLKRPAIPETKMPTPPVETKPCQHTSIMRRQDKPVCADCGEPWLPHYALPLDSQPKPTPPADDLVEKERTQTLREVEQLIDLAFEDDPAVKDYSGDTTETAAISIVAHLGNKWGISLTESRAVKESGKGDATMEAAYKVQKRRAESAESRLREMVEACDLQRRKIDQFFDNFEWSTPDGEREHAALMEEFRSLLARFKVTTT